MSISFHFYSRGKTAMDPTAKMENIMEDINGK